MKNNNNIFDEEIIFLLQGKLSKVDFFNISKKFNWKFKYKLIHIVGTNGKGSNAKFINDELINNNYKVGLFTSPHIYKYNERIKINNIDISNDYVFNFFNNLTKEVPNISFGWFDLLFLCSLNYFEENNIDVAIIEAGIGAKKDVTNYINYNYLIITSISLDHENILGNSIEKIAKDKSEAIKNNVEVFITNKISKSIIKIFQDKAMKGNSNINIINVQEKNFVDSNKTLSKHFLEKSFGINKFNSNFQLPIGRVERLLINNTICYIDVAHNIESIENSLNYYKDNKIIFDQVLLSISEDKNKEIFNIIKNNFNVIYSYQNKGRKPLSISEYDSNFIKVKNLKEFLKKLNKKTLFIGSFYLVSEILKEVYHNKEDN